MITDADLSLAVAELVPGSGAGGLGDDLTANAAALLDISGDTPAIRNFRDPGAGQPVTVTIDVDTTFTSGTFGATLEIRLVSLPINPTLLDAAAPGKATSIASVGTDVSEDEFDITGHGLAVGTPVFLTSLATTTGVSNNVVYYVIPSTANAFKLATSLANALAGTAITLGTGDGSATVNFIPTVHATTGALPIYGAKTPLVAGAKINLPLRPLATGTPVVSQQGAQTRRTTAGAGPGADLVAASPQRYLALQYLASNTITAGAINADLVLDAGERNVYPATGVETIG